MSWRDTLFVWRGRVEHDKWTGAWCGSDALDVPVNAEEDKAFEASRSEAGEGLVTGQWRSSYLMDNGAGEEKFDEEPYMLVECGPGIVAGVGTNQFGHFVIRGTIDEDGMMTLCRRYVDDRDERALLTIEETTTWSREEILDKRKKAAKNQRTKK